MKASDLPNAEWNIEWIDEGVPSEYVLWTRVSQNETLFLFVDADEGNVMDCEAIAAAHVTVQYVNGCPFPKEIIIFDDSPVMEEVDYWAVLEDIPF